MSRPHKVTTNGAGAHAAQTHTAPAALDEQSRERSCVLL